MRTFPILLVLMVSSLSACSLYFDDESEGKGKLEGAVLDAGAPCSDGGCTPGSCSDGGIDDCQDGGLADGGSWHPDGGPQDGGGWHPDGGVPDGGGPHLDGGGAPDAP